MSSEIVERPAAQIAREVNAGTLSAREAADAALAQIDRVEHRLEVGDDGLHLHDEQGPGRRVEREDIDRAAFSSNVERRLCGRDPAPTLEPFERELDEPSVPGIDQPIQSLAVPQEPDVNACVEGRRDRCKRRKGDPVGAAPFEAPDHGPRYTGRLGEANLAPAASSTKGSKPESESHDVHGNSVGLGDYRTLTGAGCRRSPAPARHEQNATWW